MKIGDKVIQKLQFLEIDFTGVADETLTSKITIDNAYDKIVGISLESSLYKEGSTIENFDFNGRNDLFAPGIMASNIQFFEKEFMPVEFTNMSNKNVTLTLKDYAAVARKVQVTLILEKK